MFTGSILIFLWDLMRNEFYPKGWCFIVFRGGGDKVFFGRKTKLFRESEDFVGRLSVELTNQNFSSAVAGEGKHVSSTKPGKSRV